MLVMNPPSSRRGFPERREAVLGEGSERGPDNNVVSNDRARRQAKSVLN